MNRTELAALASPKSLTRETEAVAAAVRVNPLRSALVSYFTSPEGLRDLADAPRVNGRQITAEEAVDALTEEAKGL